ncbi:MAG: cell envelope integrity protein CreD [Leptospirales bacterium]|nr:cell envelope integrity protein CreD [Leptospirales bacterium]
MQSDILTMKYTVKALVLSLFFIILLILLFLIRGIVNEREELSRFAEQKIMDSWGGRFAAQGPMLVIPGMKRELVRISTTQGEKDELRDIPFNLIIMPKKLNISADFKTETRKYGIFATPLFAGEVKFSGNFDPSKAIAALAPGERIFINQAEIHLILGLNGIRKISKSVWSGQELFFEPSGDSVIKAGLRAFRNAESDFDIAIDIQGGRSVRITPVGQDTHFSVSADWPSPSFQGSFLPVRSNITETSFDAQWDVNYLSRDIPLFKKDMGEIIRNESNFGVDFFKAINIYSLNMRAVKYGILFIVIPFLMIFLLEIFTKQTIHFIPYMLCGVGNLVFYLLLLSLSEQMPFFAAYFIASLAVTAMITLYSGSILALKKSLYIAVASVMAVSYIVLYGILNAESYALLIGSVTIFAVIALIMYLTRGLDWSGQK